MFGWWKKRKARRHQRAEEEAREITRKLFQEGLEEVGIHPVLAERDALAAEVRRLRKRNTELELLVRELRGAEVTR